MSENETDFGAAFDAGRKASPQVQEIGHVLTRAPFAIVQNDMHVLDLAKFAPKPPRKQGHINLQDAASFVDYTNLHKTEATRIFADLVNTRITASINHHGADDPGWRDHTATYNCPLSQEWITWMAMDRKEFEQGDFAEFLEDNLPDIADPPGAKLLAVCADLKAKQTVQFHQAVKLSNGAVQFTYQEELEGQSAQRGHIEMPERFTLGLAPFTNGPKYKIEGRLRWRIHLTKKHLRFFYILDRPYKVIESAFDEVCGLINTGTDIPVFLGTDG